MRVLITGASGFIGSALKPALNTDHDVLAAVKTHSRLISNRKENLVLDFNADNFEDGMPSNIDCIVHLAQSNSYRDFPEGSVDMRRVNIDGTHRLLEWSRKHGVKHFLFASTANVYCQNQPTPFGETSKTLASSFYGATKIAAEEIVKQYTHYFDVDVLRLFTVYGPGQTGMLIPNIIERIKTGKIIQLAKGEGIYLSPIFLNDVTDIIAKLLEKRESRAIGQSRVLNICGPERISLAGIVRQLEKIMSMTAQIENTDSDIPSYVGNNSKLIRTLGKRSFTTLNDGLFKTVYAAPVSR